MYDLNYLLSSLFRNIVLPFKCFFPVAVTVIVCFMEVKQIKNTLVLHDASANWRSFRTVSLMKSDLCGVCVCLIDRVVFNKFIKVRTWLTYTDRTAVGGWGGREWPAVYFLKPFYENVAYIGTKFLQCDWTRLGTQLERDFCFGPNPP